MDIERFEQLARKPGLTLQQLLTLCHNAQEKNRPDCVNIAEKVLNEKYPDWEHGQQRGGAKPTAVRFKDEERKFPSGKQAYHWLIEIFIKDYPELFDEINWQTAFVAKGKKRLYFSHSPEKDVF